MVTFGEVARQVKTKVKPADTDLDRYVGLEHLDPESLHIRRWGVPEDVTGEKIVVRKGDIIFGKRRAYQRKVAIAGFDCICSAHAMVLQPKEDVIIKEFFPFFLQSDQFMNRAVQISVGGLSPTINWKDLAGQEFPLPPIDEQRRIAEILWAAEDVIVKDEAFVAEVEHYKQLMMRDLFGKGIGHEEVKQIKEVGMMPISWNSLPLGDTLDDVIDYRGKTPKKLGMEWGGDIQAISARNVEMGRINFDIENYLGSDELYKLWMTKGDTKKGDIIITTEAPLGNIAQIPDNRKYILSQRVILLKTNLNIINNDYLKHYLISNFFQDRLHRCSTGTTAKGIQQKRLVTFEIPIPPLPEQHQITAILSSIDDTIAAARASAEASKALKMRLINQLLLPPIGDGS